MGNFPSSDLSYHLSNPILSGHHNKRYLELNQIMQFLPCVSPAADWVCHAWPAAEPQPEPSRSVALPPGPRTWTTLLSPWQPGTQSPAPSSHSPEEMFKHWYLFKKKSFIFFQTKFNLFTSKQFHHSYITGTSWSNLVSFLTAVDLQWSVLLQCVLIQY